MLHALLPTLLLTLLGAAVALSVGLVLALARLSRYRMLRTSANALTQLIRGTPSLVLLYFLYFGIAQVGILLSQFVAAVVVLGIYYSGYVSDAFRAAILAIPKPLIESCVALNLRHHHSWLRIILPLGWKAALPALMNYLIMAFKETAIFVAIGLPILLGKAKEIGFINFRYLEVYTLAGLIYIVCTVPAIALVRRLESRDVFE